MNNPIAQVDPDVVRLRREQLLHLISTDQRLPSLGVAITEIIKIASMGEESVNKLAKFILADIALTKDILSIANSVSYRNAQGTAVTTISKAIFILGFDVVKTSALSMLMLECFSDSDQSLYYELTHSLCASIIARECVSRSLYRDAEEASISALFKNMGQILIASQDPNLYREIMLPVNQGLESLNESAMRHLGCSLSYFGSLVLQQWNMPDSIVQAVSVLPPGEIKKTRQRSEWIKQVAAFGADAAEIVMHNTKFSKEPRSEMNFESEKYTKDLMKRYGTALELDAKKLPGWLAVAVKETEQLTIKLGMQETESSKANKDATLEQSSVVGAEEVATDDALADDFFMSCGMEKPAEGQFTHPSGKPHNARDLLLAGVMEMTQTISSGKFKLNDLVLQLLEILHGSLGFQFVTASLKDPKAERFIARISIGKDWERKQRAFGFSSKDNTDLFHLALKNNADLMIADTANAKIHNLRPEWHLTHFPEAKSVMILPLIVNQKSIGLIYADRDCEAPEGVPPDETALIKTMKGQLLAVIK